MPKYLLICALLPSHWYASPEWWLCILGVPTLLFIGRQTKATARAARAAEASVNLGEDTAKRQLRAYLAVTSGRKPSTAANMLALCCMAEKAVSESLIGFFGQMDFLWQWNRKGLRPSL